jgi:hypothetical protein
VFGHSYSAMSDAENDEPQINANGKRRVNALELGPRKKAYAVLSPAILHCTVLTTILSSKSDPLVHHGRHFCRTIHAMCNIHALLTQSVIREVEQTADEDLSDECVICFLLSCI